MPVNPTIVIGVGEAGCKMASDLYDDLDAMHDGEAEFLNEFKFIGIDTRAEDLDTHARPNFTTIPLDQPMEYWENNREEFHYLTDDFDLEPAGGATRQRAVSRYYIDNPVNFDDLYQRLNTTISDFLDRERSGDDDEVRSNPNIWIVNSFGGGTGSGAFPLLTAIVDAVTDDRVWMGGIGSLPRLDQLEPTPHPPSSDPTLYANAYAALREIAVLVDYEFTDTDECAFTSAKDGGFPVEIPLCSDTFLSQDSFVLDEPPFDFYGLMGLEESESGSYKRKMNRIAANTILFFSQKTGLEDFGSGLQPRGNERLFALDSTGLQVPVSKLDEYVNAAKELETKVERRARVHRSINHHRVNRDTINYLTDIEAGQSPSHRPTLGTTLLDPETGDGLEFDEISRGIGGDEDEAPTERVDADSASIAMEVGVDVYGAWKNLPEIHAAAAEKAEAFPMGGYTEEVLESRRDQLVENVVSLPGDFDFDSEDVATYFFYQELVSRYRKKRSEHPFPGEIEDEWEKRADDVDSKTSVDAAEFANVSELEKWEDALSIYYEKRIEYLKRKLDDLSIWERSKKKEVKRELSAVEKHRDDLQDSFRGYDRVNYAIEQLQPKVQNLRTSLDDQRRTFEDELRDDLEPEKANYDEEIRQLESTLDALQNELGVYTTGRFVNVPFDDFERVSSGTLEDVDDIETLIDRRVVSKRAAVRATRDQLDRLDESIQDRRSFPIGESPSDYLGVLAARPNQKIVEGGLDDDVPDYDVGESFDTFDETALVDLEAPFDVRLVAMYKNIRLENTSEFGTFHEKYTGTGEVSREFGLDIPDEEFLPPQFAYPEFFPNDSGIQGYFGLQRQSVETDD